MIGITSLFNTESKKVKLILLVFLVVYHLALFYSLSNGPVLLSDSQEYINSSQSFEQRGNFYSGNQNVETDYRHFGKRTPLYPLVLFSLHALNLHQNYIYIMQTFMGLFNIFLSLVLLRLLLPEKKPPYFLLGFLIMATPSQIIYSQLVMADLWLQSFVMICMIAIAKYLTTQRQYWLISLIIFSTLAALTKPAFLLASMFIGAICLVTLFKRKFRLAAMLGLLPFISWYIVSSKNEKLSGVFHYSSIGYINLLHYNTNLFLNKTIGKAETEKLLEPLMVVPHSKGEFKQNYTEVNKVCTKALLAHFPGYSTYHLKGVAYFFLDPGRFDVYNFFRIETDNSNGFLHKGNDKIKSVFSAHPILGVGLLIIFLINILKTFGFLGFLWFNRKNRLVLFGAAIVLYFAFLTGPLGASRFALPVELIIICFASGYYLRFLKKKETEK